MRSISAILFAATLLALSGCEDSMRDQARIKPFEPSAFFADGRSARVPPEGTIARGELREDRAFFTGRDAQGLVARMPLKVTGELLARGQQRFNIYCALCHGADGYGRGMIVERGFTPPPSYHIQRLLEAPDGHFFDVITHGKGAMYAHASRVAPADRWAIIAYIRALQLSQRAKLDDVPAAEKAQLEEAAQ